MTKTFKPDKKLYTKSIWILLTISVCIILISSIIHLIIYLTGSLTNASTILWLVTIGIMAVMWVISLPFVKLWIKNLQYILREDRVTIHKGILTKTQQNIPYRAVTDFALIRSIYDRLLGIGSIKIQTAGQSQTPGGYEGSLLGLPDYENIHQELRNRLKFLHPQSESLTTMEPETGQTDERLLEQILLELKAIRKNTQR